MEVVEPFLELAIGRQEDFVDDLEARIVTSQRPLRLLSCSSSPNTEALRPRTRVILQEVMLQGLSSRQRDPDGQATHFAE